jgi:hypothetical protein
MHESLNGIGKIGIKNRGKEKYTRVEAESFSRKETERELRKRKYNVK